MYLLDKIIEKCEYHSVKDWKPEEVGNRIITIQQKDYTKCGKTELINEIRDLEERKVPILQDLIDKLVQEGKGIEQEIFIIESISG